VGLQGREDRHSTTLANRRDTRLEERLEHLAPQCVGSKGPRIPGFQFGDELLRVGACLLGGGPGQLRSAKFDAVEEFHEGVERRVDRVDVAVGRAVVHAEGEDDAGRGVRRVAALPCGSMRDQPREGRV